LSFFASFLAALEIGGKKKSNKKQSFYNVLILSVEITSQYYHHDKKMKMKMETVPITLA